MLVKGASSDAAESRPDFRQTRTAAMLQARIRATTLGGDQFGSNMLTT